MKKFVKAVSDLILIGLWVAILAGKWLDAVSVYFPWITVAITGYFTWEHILERQPLRIFVGTQFRRNRIMAFVIVFLSGGLLASLYLYGAIRLTDTLNAAQKAKTAERGTGANQVALYVDCSPLPLPLGIGPNSFARMMMLYPRVFPFSDELTIVRAAQDRARGFPEPNDVEPVANRGSFDKDLFRFQVALHCEISNHGDAALQAVDIPIQIEFFRERDVRYQDKEKDATDRVYGPPKSAPVAQIRRTIRIAPLDINGVFNFYGINVCPGLVAVVLIPNVATASRQGSPERIDIPLQRKDSSVFGPQVLLNPSSMRWKGYEEFMQQ